MLTSIDAERVELAAVLTGEVVANAIKHGEPPIVLAVGGDEEEVKVTVTDCGDELPVLRTPDLAAQDGRGLRIVDVLSDGWGVDRLPHGKRIWFRLGVHGHHDGEVAEVPDGAE